MSADKDMIERAFAALHRCRSQPEEHYPIRDALVRMHEMHGAILAHNKPDRSALLRMAGNIAGGLAANPQIDVPPGTDAAEVIARVSVKIARAIMDEIDNPTTDEKGSTNAPTD